MTGGKNFLSGLQMADQYNRWVICLKPVSLNIRNIEHSIYSGFHGERSFNWVTIKCNHFCTCTTSECSRSFILCCKLCSKFSPKALNWKCFKCYWTYLKILIIQSKFSKMNMYRRTIRFACMYDVWSSNHSTFLRMLQLFLLTLYTFLYKYRLAFFL